MVLCSTVCHLLSESLHYEHMHQAFALTGLIAIASAPTSVQDSAKTFKHDLQVYDVHEFQFAFAVWYAIFSIIFCTQSFHSNYFV